jgi:hypothetical protein
VLYNVCKHLLSWERNFASFIYSHRNGLSLIVSTCLGRYSWSLTIALRISRSGAKIIKLVDELDKPEGYVARDLCIFMNEVGWNPDRTIMNGNSIYNGTRMSGVLLYTFFLYICIIWGYKKVNKSSSEKSSSEQNSSWRNIKIKYCIVWKKEKEKEKLYLLIKKEHNFLRAFCHSYVK